MIHFRQRVRAKSRKCAFFPLAYLPSLRHAISKGRACAVLASAAIMLAACGDEENTKPTRSTAFDPNAWLTELQERPEYRQACMETPGCPKAREPVTGPQEPIWRIQVIRDSSGEVEIGRIDALLVPEGDGVPPGRATGDYLLVGVDSSRAPIDGQMIQFPRVLRIEFEDRSHAPREVDLAGRRVDTVGYIRANPSIRAIEVQEESGNAIATAAPPATSLTAVRTGSSSFEFISSAYAQNQLSNLPLHCSHIWILQGEADREYAGTLAFNEYVATLEPPGPYQLAAVAAALKQMTPLLCGAVGRIAFAHLEAMEKQAVGAVLQAGEGEIVMINSASYPESKLDPTKDRNAKGWGLTLQKTVLHESGHSVESLLNATGADPGVYGGEWTVPARDRAKDVLDNARLRKGFGEEWRRVHQSFVDVGWAKAHSINGMIVSLPASGVVSGGFMTSYGSNIWWDDISEFISEIYMGPDFPAGNFQSNDLACQAMQGWSSPNVPSSLAAVYTKALFLRDLGLVKPADVKTCLGNTLGLQSMQKGLHFWLDGKHYRSFTQNLKAGIHTEAIAKNRVFTLEGEGEAGFGGTLYPAKLTLRLDLRSLGEGIDEVSWPRGVYELGLVSDNNVHLVLDGAPAGNFDAMDGFVLVAEASNERISGSIVLQRVMRLQAPLPVPERYDPPLVIRLLVEK